MRWKVTCGACFVWTALSGGCEPAPVNDGRFWTGKSDSGIGVISGSGGADDPAGSGGSDAVGSGGDTGSGGAPGTGGADNGSNSGGAYGTGGMVAGSGGVTGSGTGGNVASGGTVGSGGVTASGGATSSGGGTGSGGASSGGSTSSGGASIGGKNGSGGASSGGSTSSGGASSGGSNGVGGTMGMGGRSGSLTGTLKVSVTTKSAGGRYAPDNVGAIWIADSGTKFVKSLYVWGSQRRRELSTWTSATSAAGLANNLVDAVTGATMHDHGVRMATWNGTNTAKALVPDGAYKVCFELRDGSGQSQCVDFNKGRDSQTLSPADTGPFTKRSVGYTP